MFIYFFFFEKLFSSLADFTVSEKNVIIIKFSLLFSERSRFKKMIILMFWVQPFFRILSEHIIIVEF